MMQFKYLPLESEQHIRILNLQPAEANDDRLWVTLERVHIEEAADNYEALSYAWGPPDFTCQIHVARKHGPSAYIAITESLHKALCRFRHPNKVRRLWADAVCINQTDDSEKSSQIQLMRKIYKWASRVLVWLGECDPRVENALRDIARMSRGVVGNVSEDYHPLLVLQSVPYFGRRWIIQEIALNIDVQLFLGEAQIPWARVYCALQADVSASKKFVQPRAQTLEKLSRLWKHKSGFAQETGHHQGSQSSLGIFGLLESFTHSKCGNPRDMIYAISGLAIDTVDANETQSISNKWPMIPIMADYSKSVEEVYTQFALASIEKSYGLEILVARCDRPMDASSSSATLPSWVPDWRIRPHHSIGQLFLRTIGTSRDKPGTIQLTTAGSTETPEVHVQQFSVASSNSNGDPMLRVRAVLSIPPTRCLDAIRDFLASYSPDCSGWCVEDDGTTQVDYYDPILHFLDSLLKVLDFYLKPNYWTDRYFESPGVDGVSEELYSVLEGYNIYATHVYRKGEGEVRAYTYFGLTREAVCEGDFLMPMKAHYMADHHTWASRHVLLREDSTGTFRIIGGSLALRFVCLLEGPYEGDGCGFRRALREQGPGFLPVFGTPKVIKLRLV